MENLATQLREQGRGKEASLWVVKAVQGSCTGPLPRSRAPATCWQEAAVHRQQRWQQAPGVLTAWRIAG